MEPDNSFKALFDPGSANNFFDITNLAGFESVSNTSYNRTNALWLAEFCRLIYRQENGEVSRPDAFVTRGAFLESKGWREEAFFNQGGTQAGIFLKDKDCAALVFRGTLGLKDVITDAEFLPDAWQFGGNVHGGFKEAFGAVWDNVKNGLLSLNVPVFFTGHSLGAALATLAASQCRKDPALAKCGPAALYTFGSPRVGDQKFGATLNGLFHCRVVNNKDLVPTMPPVLPVEGVTFRHTGQLHLIEPNGHLHVFPPDTDSIELRGPISGPVNLIRSLEGLLSGVRTFGLEPPLPLRDHTPVNYTAALERAS